MSYCTTCGATRPGTCDPRKHADSDQAAIVSALAAEGYTKDEDYTLVQGIDGEIVLVFPKP